MAEQGLAISQRIYGSDHLTTCTAESLYASNLLAMGRKEEALAVLAKIPLSKGSDAMLMQRTTAILLWFGRDDEHEAVCRKMLEQVADTKDPGVADRVAKACNLRASPPLDMVDAALELARKSTELGKGQNLNPFFKLCLGLAQYRKGDYKAAETSLDEVRASGDRSWNILHLNRFLTAMNTYKLGREEEARTLLAKAETEFGTFPVDELKPFSQPRGVEPIIVWVIHREAKALIFPGGR